MTKLAVTAAMGIAMLVAGSEFVRAEDIDHPVDYASLTTDDLPSLDEGIPTNPAATAITPVITPWETRETNAALPTAEDRRAMRRVRYGQLINRYASEYGVPAELAEAVIQVESNFRPTVKGTVGEIGLMQVRPATAQLMGYRGPDYGLYDPETNIRYGMKYLAGAHDLGDGKICGTILKYNAGHAAKRMNPISKRYCDKVEAILDGMQQTASLSTVAF